ncbi:unnamed protein product [Calypogeia fissa]
MRLRLKSRILSAIALTPSITQSSIDRLDTRLHIALLDEDFNHKVADFGLNFVSGGHRCEHRNDNTW